MIYTSDYFDISDDLLGTIVPEREIVWETISALENRLHALLDGRHTVKGKVMPGVQIDEVPLYIAKGAVIEPDVYIAGPAYIEDGVVVRQGAYLRGNVVLMKGSILGHAAEIKNSILLPKAQAPHFNYIGDSILGRRVNLGAGTRLSNLPITSTKDQETGERSSIVIEIDGVIHDTGRAKFGAILGDDCQTGCNAVLNPGCLVGPGSLIYANCALTKGFHPPNKIIKLRQVTECVERSDT